MKFEDAAVHRRLGTVAGGVRRQGEFRVEEQRAVFAEVAELLWKTLLASGFDDEATLLETHVSRLGGHAG